MFGTSGRFGEMVREGYPMVWHPGEVRFSDRRCATGGGCSACWSPTGRGVPCPEYEMVKGDQGWRIDGVRRAQEGAAGRVTGRRPPEWLTGR